MTNDSTAQDRQLLHDYSRETRDPYVQRLLAELLGHVNRAGFERTAGAGGGNTRDLGQGQYAVSYAYTPDTTRADHLAVLVHELTHVAVNQAYGSRMLNFPVPPLSAAEENRVRDETPGREEDFQNAALRRADARRRDAYVDLVIGNVQRLLDELRGSGLPAERQRAIRTKLTDHMRARPYHEYDGVLSHVLTWSDLDGVDRSSAFYRSLTAMVAQTADWRAAGDITLPRRRRGFFRRLGRRLAAALGMSRRR
ncbi:hypothetical protein DMH15_41270 [Streptomyces sp. WAC 06725]|uniref:hypothetical protein n=1 Tax=Streptomyces sp. WAC 06725 TaxID=2203209 RepID=UPI000F74498F|nr:hypothetical protein [Streptomyces sp. WAC 06725]RSO10033.1 hypothetical protein DMH15_41270 [Streptomyces sp. WAC 06725]